MGKRENVFLIDNASISLQSHATVVLSLLWLLIWCNKFKSFPHCDQISRSYFEVQFPRFQSFSKNQEQTSFSSPWKAVLAILLIAVFPIKTDFVLAFWLWNGKSRMTLPVSFVSFFEFPREQPWKCGRSDRNCLIPGKSLVVPSLLTSFPLVTPPNPEITWYFPLRRKEHIKACQSPRRAHFQFNVSPCGSWTYFGSFCSYSTWIQQRLTRRNVTKSRNWNWLATSMCALVSRLC